MKCLRIIPHLAVLLLLAVAAPLRAAETPVLLVLGDSLSAAWGIDETQGWVRLLETRLAGRDCAWTVRNASISGETTRGALTRLPALLAEHRPRFVVVALGGNDGLHGLLPDEMRANLDEIVALAQDGGAEVMIAGIHMPPNYGKAFAERFHAVFHEVAAARSVPLLPFLLEGVAEDRALMLPDGLHPAAEAQPRILDNVWPVLAPQLSCR